MNVAPARRHVVSVVDDVHRDLAVADDAVAGRFTHAGITLELGRRPDWIDGGTSDEEWRIEWVKLYEGLHLAHAVELTGERRYADCWRDLVESFCDQVPVGHDTSDVTARRLQNWLYAWQRIETAAPDSIPPVLADRLTARFAAEADHLGRHLTPERNHRTMELYTLLLVAISFDDPAGAHRALRLLAANAAEDVLDDGVQRERSSDYHMIVLRSLVGAVANARAAGLDVPDELERRTRLACTFGLHLQRPDGSTPALSDGDQGDFRSLLLLAGEVLDRPDLVWAARAGTAGEPPRERDATFPVGGYAVQRSGWGDDARLYRSERWAILDCGPLGDGGHGHYDHLNVELAAGRRLVVDPGRYTYDADDGDWRHWFKGTAAHNTVTVDDLDQTPFRPGKPKGPTSTATLRYRHTSDALDVVVAEARSPRYEAIHTRALVFVDRDHWVIVDHLDGTRSHTYTARWHLDPSLGRRPRVERTATLTVVHTAAAAFAFAHADVTVEDGWVSPSYGEKVEAAVVAVHAPVAASTTFTTVVRPSGVAPREVTTVRAGSVTTVVLRDRDVIRTITWDPDAARSEVRPC